MKTKQCKKCKNRLSIDQFYSGSRYKDRTYLSSCCKNCLSENSKERYRNIVVPQVQQNPKKRLLALAKSRAKSKNIPFDLCEEDFDLPTHCPILGVELCVSISGLSDMSYSLDRIVPELGYVKGNVQVISHLANSMKFTANPETLKLFAKWILETYK